MVGPPRFRPPAAAASIYILHECLIPRIQRMPLRRTSSARRFRLSGPTLLIRPTDNEKHLRNSFPWFRADLPRAARKSHVRKMRFRKLMAEQLESRQVLAATVLSFENGSFDGFNDGPTINVVSAADNILNVGAGFNSP